MGKKNVLTRATESLDRSLGKAFENSHKMVGVPVDPDVRLYNKLQPEDLRKLEKTFGRDTVVDYVKEMESRKILED